MCPYPKMTRKKTHMDFSLFRKIIDESEFYGTAPWLHLFGEPLMNPEIFDMIKYCKSRGLGVRLSTNITLLSPENSLRFLKSGLDLIILSLDGATKETYEKIRRGADFEMAKQNIKTFLDLKKRERSNIYVILSIIRMGETEKELKAFKKEWNNPMIDEILIKDFRVWGSQVKGIEKLASQGWKPKPRVPRYPCRHFWTDVVVAADGKVLPCCFDYDAKLVLGDLSKQTLLEMWNSDVVKKVREAQSRGDFSNPLCKDCTEWDGCPPRHLFPLRISKRPQRSFPREQTWAKI
jgi:radical SAM protein with 4Fe4S-binding SPASM domain